MRTWIVTGTRRGLLGVTAALDHLLWAYPPDRLLVGCSAGVDAAARKWAVGRKLPFTVFYAEWKRYKKRAGSIRNQIMVNEAPADALGLGFPDDYSTGTWDCLRRLRARGISIELPLWNKPWKI